MQCHNHHNFDDDHYSDLCLKNRKLKCLPRRCLTCYALVTDVSPLKTSQIYGSPYSGGETLSRKALRKMRKWYGVVLQVRAKFIFLYFFRTPWSKSYHIYKNTNSAWWLERPVMPCFLGMPPTLYRFKHIMVINIIISLQVRPTFQHRNQPWLLAWILKKT